MKRSINLIIDCIYVAKINSDINNCDDINIYYRNTCMVMFVSQSNIRRKKKLNKKIRNSQFAISQCCGNYGSRVID